MRMTVRRWLITAGAAAAAGGMVWGQAGAATAARMSPAAPKAAASSPTYKPPSKPLYYGETGAAVKSVQTRLNQLHYYAGPDDGVYGEDTQQAIWAFREVQGLRVNAYNNAEPANEAFLKALVHPKAPKPLVPKGGATRIEINQNIQVLVFYKNGHVADIFHASTGGRYYYPCPGAPSETCGPAITPDGNYHALSFASGWVQVPLGEMYNPTFFIGTAYAIHGDEPVPWYPASHGCVRIWMDAANWFHTKLSIGGSHPTPIYIRGTAPAYPAGN
jgi:Putative peptidoglycan binding domain/L,D-transpeptidase catalytic domain